MVIGVCYDSSIKAKIIDIVAYLGNDQREIFESKENLVFFYDLVLSTEEGLIKVLFNPQSTKCIQNGLLLEGKHIILKKITKISLKSGSFLLVNELSFTGDTGDIQSNDSWIKLAQYLECFVGRVT